MLRNFGNWFRLLSLLAALCTLMPEHTVAQVQGNKTVWTSSTQQAPSVAWIDASAFWTNGQTPDLCAIIKGILSSVAQNYPNGVVIDARGVYNANPTPPGSVMCTNTPFDTLTVNPPPTTILLPARQHSSLKDVGFTQQYENLGCRCTPRAYPIGHSQLKHRTFCDLQSHR